MDRISRMRQNQLTNELDTCTPSVEMSKINASVINVVINYYYYYDLFLVFIIKKKQKTTL